MEEKNMQKLSEEELTQVSGGVEGETLYGEEDGPRYYFEDDDDRDRTEELIERSKNYTDKYAGTDRDLGGIIEVRKESLSRRSIL